MNDAELGTLLDEFKRLHAAGSRPDPAEFLARAGESADDFAELLDVYLAEHPAPALSGAELDRMASSALFDPPAWGQLLVEAREEQGILRSDVVGRLTSALGLRPEQQARVAEHLHELETGALAPRRVSQRVIDALDGIFRGIGAALNRTRLIEPPVPTASEAFARDALAEVDVPDHHSEPDTEVDDLFLGREDR
jgi:hypothetical protein